MLGISFDSLEEMRAGKDMQQRAVGQTQTWAITANHPSISQLYCRVLCFWLCAYYPSTQSSDFSCCRDEHRTVYPVLCTVSCYIRIKVGCPKKDSLAIQLKSKGDYNYPLCHIHRYVFFLSPLVAR